MGFFRNLFRRKPGPEKPPVPDPGPDPDTELDTADMPSEIAHLFGPPEADTPMVLAPLGKAMMIVDRMTYEYQQGLARGADPSQKALDAVLDRADRVRVLDGGVYRDETLGTRILAEVDDPAAIASLRRALRIVEDPATFGHCSCLGYPAIEIYAGDERLAAIAVHHGKGIRWPAWKHDAQLADGRPIAAWLAERGVELGTGPGNPEDPMLLNLLAMPPAVRHAARAESYRIRNEPERALEECHRALETDPGLAMALAIRAGVLADLGRFDEAMASGEEALARGFEHPVLHATLSGVYEALGDNDRAMAHSTEALRLDPTHAHALFTRGILHARLGRLDEALADLAGAVKSAPEWAQPRWHLGMLHAERQEFGDATAQFSAVIDLLEGLGLRPDDASSHGFSLSAAYAMRGRAHVAAGEAEKARADGDAAIRLDPDDIGGYLTRGLALERLGRPAEAAEDYERFARDLPPEETYGMRLVARARSLSGDTEGAIEMLDRILAIEPDDAEMRIPRAQSLLVLNRDEEALEEVEEAIRLRPDSSVGYYIRAQCWKRLRRRDRQAEDLNTALRWEPDNAMILNDLAWFLATCPDDAFRDGARAEVLAMRAADLTEGKNSYVINTLSAALAELGKFDLARERLRQSIEMEGPGDPNELREQMRVAFDQDRPFRDDRRG